MKAGLMEIADVFVINKADRDGADVLAREIEATLDTRSDLDGWRAPVLLSCALRDEGGAELVAAVESHREFLRREGRLSRERREALLRRLRRAVLDRVAADLWADGERERTLEKGLAKLLAGRLSFTDLVDSVLPPRVAAPDEGDSQRED
jgi:LAO/AO transport system kinase